jgi:ABC-2 type transport system ATP-binding protein
MYDSLVRDTNNVAKAGVKAEGLGKRYDDLWALRDLDLNVEPGSVLGLLGHNGAGKTTAIRILTTLALPTEGTGSVAGFDVVHQSDQVRRRIGVAAQEATVDGLLTGRFNLEMFGRLCGLSKHDARQRAGELLEQLDLIDAADTQVKTYSGGMRRRLDLAASLVGRPSVLFLDEPTTGLDPKSRNGLWDLLRDLVLDGTTVILTTQYLEEADHLADDIIVLDHGRNVAHGTPEQLKARIGTDRIDVTVAHPSALVAAADALSSLVSGEPSIDEARLVVTAPITAQTRLIDLVRALDDPRIDVVDVDRRQSTLDDVFLTLTSTTHPAESPA